MPLPQKRDYIEYELVSITVTREFQGVWAHLDSEKKPDIHVSVLDGIAVAKMQIRSTEDCELIHEEIHIVGLQLCGGRWEITNESENFVGMARSESEAYLLGQKYLGINESNLDAEFERAGGY